MLRILLRKIFGIGAILRLSQKWCRRITVSGMSALAQTTITAKVESCSLGERTLPNKRYIRILRHPFLSVLILLTAVPFAIVQAQPSSKLHAFRAISMEGAISELALISDGELIDCKIPSHRRSKAIVAQGEETLRFVLSGTVIPEGGVDAIPVVVEAPIAEQFSRPLYVFYPRGDAYGVFAVEDSLNKIGGGMGMFVNLSPYPMVLLLGAEAKDQVNLDPRETRIHEFGEGSLNVRLRIATLSNDEAKKGMDTRVFPASTHRDIYFIYPAVEGEDGMVRMRLLREHVNAAQRAFAVKSNI